MTIEQLQQGLIRYAEKELLPALPEPARIVAGTGVYLFVKNKLPGSIGALTALGCTDGEEIDLDALYEAVKRYFPKKLEIPMDDLIPAGIGKILFPGKAVKMELTPENIETLYKTLKGEDG